MNEEVFCAVVVWNSVWSVTGFGTLDSCGLLTTYLALVLDCVCFLLIRLLSTHIEMVTYQILKILERLGGTVWSQQRTQRI